MTHVELNKTYVGSDNDDGDNMFQAVYLFMSDDYKPFSGVWNDFNNNNIMGTEN